MTGRLNVCDYTDPVNEKGTAYQGYRAEVNSYWVTIYKSERGTGRPTEEVVFERVPKMDEWLDAKHSRITRAMDELENALRAVIEVKETL